MSAGPVTLDALLRAREVLNLFALARLAGINPHTLAAKLRRGTPISVEEGEALRRALLAAGVELDPA